MCDDPAIVGGRRLGRKPAVEDVIADPGHGTLPSKLFTPCWATMLIVQEPPGGDFRLVVSVRLHVGGGEGRIFSSDRLAGQRGKRGAIGAAWWPDFSTSRPMNTSMFCSSKNTAPPVPSYGRA